MLPAPCSLLPALCSLSFALSFYSLPATLRDTAWIGHGPPLRTTADPPAQPLASPSQLISHISADLTSAESSEAALNDAVVAWGGKAPDHVYLCAGFSRPKFFVDMDAQHMKEVSAAIWL
jgi:hypothetical protein